MAELRAAALAAVTVAVRTGAAMAAEMAMPVRYSMYSQYTIHRVNCD